MFIFFRNESWCYWCNWTDSLRKTSYIHFNRLKFYYFSQQHCECHNFNFFGTKLTDDTDWMMQLIDRWSSQDNYLLAVEFSLLRKFIFQLPHTSLSCVNQNTLDVRFFNCERKLWASFTQTFMYHKWLKAAKIAWFKIHMKEKLRCMTFRYCLIISSNHSIAFKINIEMMISQFSQKISSTIF